MRKLFLILVISVLSVHCAERKTRQFLPSTYGVPSAVYGQPSLPVSSYNAPQGSVLNLFDQGSFTTAAPIKTFGSFNSDFFKSHNQPISVTSPASDLLLPSVGTNVDFLGGFSSTTASPILEDASVVVPHGQSFESQFGSTTFAPPTFEQNVHYNNVPSLNHFGLSSSPLDFTAYSTPKPVISEYSNVGIHNVFKNEPVFGQTSQGYLSDSFGVSTAAVSPLVENTKTEVSKHLYFFSAPEEIEEEQDQPDVHVEQLPGKKTYKIIFIKTPEVKPAKSVVVNAGPQNEEKTLIYVLSKKPEAPGNIEVRTAPPVAPAKPEVFFIKYKTEKEAQQAVSQVQDAHSNGQLEDQQFLTRFAQENKISNSQALNDFSSKFGVAPTSSSADFNFKSTTTLNDLFGTSTPSPLATFTSTFSPKLLSNYNFGQSSFDTGLPSFGNYKFGQNFYEPSSQSPFVSTTVVPSSGFGSFYSTTQSPLVAGRSFGGDFISNSQGLGATSSPLSGFESFSSTVAPQFVQSSSSSPFDTFFGQRSSFESSTASPLLENFGTSTPSSLFEGSVFGNTQYNFTDASVSGVPSSAFETKTVTIGNVNLNAHNEDESSNSDTPTDLVPQVNEVESNAVGSDYAEDKHDNVQPGSNDEESESVRHEVYGPPKE